MTDTTAFPELGGAAVTANVMDTVPEPDDYTAPARPWYIFDDSESESDTNNGTLLSGWVLLTSADARKPIPKPIVDLGTESEDDEDTMPMTTTKRMPKPKTRTEPYIDRTAEEILELFRIDVARHDREIEDRENDLYDDYSDDDLDWNRQNDSYFGAIDDYANEEEGDEEDEYEYE